MTSNEYFQAVKRIAQLQRLAAQCTDHKMATKILAEAAMLQSLTVHPQDFEDRLIRTEMN